MPLICLTTVLLNLTNIPFNEQDFKAIARSEQVCKERYKGCITTFQKREQGVYRTMCGDKEFFDREMLDSYEKSAIMEELRHLPKKEQRKKLEELGYTTEE